MFHSFIFDISSTYFFQLQICLEMSSTKSRFKLGNIFYSQFHFLIDFPKLIMNQLSFQPSWSFTGLLSLLYIPKDCFRLVPNNLTQPFVSSDIICSDSEIEKKTICVSNIFPRFERTSVSFSSFLICSSLQQYLSFI